MKKVLICAPIRDCAGWLPRSLETIDNLDYPRELLSYSYVEGNSKDNTLEIITKWLLTKKRWSLIKIDFPSDWRFERRVHESTIRNFKLMLEDEDYVFIVESDVVYMPPETLKVLISKDVDIIHPYIYIDDTPVPGNKWAGLHQFYDTWGFRYRGVPWDNNCKTAVKMVAKADPETGLIPMDSVGQNPVLIKREVIDEVEYHGDNAIVGFCTQARKFGYEIYSYPAIKCIHAWESI